MRDAAARRSGPPPPRRMAARLLPSHRGQWHAPWHGMAFAARTGGHACQMRWKPGASHLPHLAVPSIGVFIKGESTTCVLMGTCVSVYLPGAREPLLCVLDHFKLESMPVPQSALQWALDGSFLEVLAQQPRARHISRLLFAHHPLWIPSSAWQSCQTAMAEKPNCSN